MWGVSGHTPNRFDNITSSLLPQAGFHIQKNEGSIHIDWTSESNSVLQVLQQGYRTGDIMSPGMKLVGCQAMGEALMEILELKSR